MLINLMYRISHDYLELLNVPVLEHVVHWGHGVLFMLINLMCLMTLLNFSMYLSFYMFYLGVMVNMDCTLINFMHI
jgi:hypothetical protein